MIRLLRKGSLPEGFGFLFGADLVARSVYQAGKSLILPLFAEALGAPAALLGLIVSISTTTGILSKPLFGHMSDRLGRKRLLIAAALVFISVPLFYLGVSRASHLLILRPVHGLATAILGPVTLAWLVDRSPKHRVRNISWFGVARSGSYLLGPILGSVLLVYLESHLAFASLGLLSVPVLIFALGLPRDELFEGLSTTDIRKSLKSVIPSFALRFRKPAIVLTSLEEGLLYLGTYATKTFLPIFGLANGFSVGEVGLVMSVKVAITMIVQPSLGQVGDHMPRRWVVALGMAGIAMTLPLFAMTRLTWILILLAVVQGICEAIITPSTAVLIADLAPQKDRGAVLGFYGSIRNVGKVVGPVVAGLLIDYYSYTIGYTVLSSCILLVTSIFLYVVVKTEKTAKIHDESMTSL